MARRDRRSILEDVSEHFMSGTPMFACDADLRIVSWNEAAEKLTGIEAEDAVGQRCWQVLHGHDDDGSLVCHRGCSNARLAREGWPVSAYVLNIKTRDGAKRIGVDVVSASESDFRMLHLLRDAPEDAEPAPRPARAPLPLTARQLEVLQLLDSGMSAREIAEHFGLRLPTVRNHIHAILIELGTHSQLQAVAQARKLGLIPSKPS
jgi:PAS domain S-box-containing protein